MKYIALFIVAILFIGGCQTTGTYSKQREVRTQLQQLPTSDSLLLAKKSLVTIQDDGLSIGHGVIITYNNRPHILTAYHVIQDAHILGRTITSIYDEQILELELVKWEFDVSDVAVLAIVSDGVGLTPVTFDTASNPAFIFNLFENHLYVANADGYSSMRPVGFGNGRLLSSEFHYPVVFGTSGSPVFNNKGFCIGIVVATDNKNHSLYINYLWLRKWMKSP